MIVFVFSIFFSASLLFMIQPMFARMALPLLGGSPSVWNTAMLFYQVVLLGGYTYAHLITRRLSLRKQVIVHGFVMLLPLLVLPIGIPEGWVPPEDRNPAFWLLALMSATIGLPFFAVSTTSPLIQRWFSLSKSTASKDPYFLYAASNAGSLLALVSYPFLVEPSLRLTYQARFWSIGYVGFVVAMILCSFRTLSATSVSAKEPPSPSVPPDGRTRMRWTLLAFIPSSLMLSVTTFLTNEVAAVPLLWIIPLSLYLLSFILVFSSREILKVSWCRRAAPILVVALTLLVSIKATEPFSLLFSFHLLTFFCLAMTCHGALAECRPSSENLTGFYLYMSIGGALGGIFNALVAPVVFNAIYEYPVVLALACIFSLAPKGEARWPERREWLIPALIGASAWIMALIVQSSPAAGKPIAAALAFSLPILACFFTSKRHAAFGLAILSVMVVAQQSSLQLGSIQLRRRGFYGMHSVAVDQHAGLIKLLHGQTIHGGQYLDPAKSMAPTFYYHPQGPLGEAFQAIHARHDLESVALVGLGAGTALCYSEEGESWHLFEIDPEVEWIAKDSGYFSFLKNASAKWRIQLGDARITLNREKQSSFDFLIIDAFSSDVIPAHLLTKEAFTLYLSLIREDGFIAINVSNRHLNVDRVVAAVASHLGLTIIEKTDDLLNSGRKSEGTVASQWMLMQREEDESLGLLLEKGWMRPETDASYIWTDDFYDLIRIMK